jgi:hypothetical protein
MRVSGCAAKLLLVLALASPALLRAQFQEPTPEELKMTADPKAPGAAAVYLYYEETSDSPAHTSGFYVRIKVLTEKGKDLATVSIPYEPAVDKLTAIEGRTIHSDGTVVPLTAKPEDLMDVKTKGYQMNTLIFSLPSVEVGSILEYRVKFSRNAYLPTFPEWRIQMPYFVHKSHFSFNPWSFLNMMYAVHLGCDAKVVQDKKGAFTLDIADVPPEPDDDWMPPMNTLRWRVEFFISHTYDSTGDDWWKDAGKVWTDRVKDFIKPTGQIKKAAAAIFAPEDTDEKKAEKIYAAVMKLENTSFTRQKSKAERKKEKLEDIDRAEDVWKQQAGTDDEIALLYVSLARAAGLNVWPMVVVDRNRALFDKTYLSTRQFDDMIAMVEIGGKDVYLDPGQKMCPYRSLHWKHTLATGFSFKEKVAVLSITPGFTYKNSTLTRVGSLSIDETGNVKGIVRFGMTGPQALYWRQLTLENDEEEVKKQFNEWMQTGLPEGVQADFDHFLALEDYNASLIGIVNVSGNLGTVTGKHFVLPGLFFQSRAKHPFVAQDKRVTPIDVHYPNTEQDDVTYELPAEFNVEGMPPDVDNSWPGHALLKINFNKDAGSITIRRTLIYNFTFLEPQEYSNLHDFFLKVAAADQQQLVLTRTPVAKGN